MHTTSPRRANPGKYFEKGTGLLAVTLADDVRRADWTILDGTRAEYHPVDILAFERNRDLYVYDRGVWVPEGEREVHCRTRQLLGDHYRPSHAATVLDIIQHHEEVLEDRPHTDYINCMSGMIHWPSRELYDHSPGDHSRIQIPTPYDKAADCPEFITWLHEVVGHECVQLVFEMIGYCLLNDNPMQKAFLIYGPGGNGKGTLLRTIEKVLGAHNACAVSPQDLDADRWAPADLFDKLANLAGDVSARGFGSTENFKKATGGDLLRAERKYGQPFQFKVRATTIAAYNELPTTTDTTRGFFRRWVVLPMDRADFSDSIDPGREKRIQTPGELAGILAHAIDALGQVMTRGEFSTPEPAVRAKERFEEHAHPVKAFMVEYAEKVCEGPWVKEKRSQVYQAYKLWASDNGMIPLGARRFHPDAAALRLADWAITPTKLDGYDVYMIERKASST